MHLHGFLAQPVHIHAQGRPAAGGALVADAVVVGAIVAHGLGCAGQVQRE
jgi:hypothetical protein